MTGAVCGVGNAYLPEHLISPLVFIEVHFVLSFVSPYYYVIVLSFVFCLLSFDCSFCLTAWYLYMFYLSHLDLSFLLHLHVQYIEKDIPLYLI